MARPPSTYQLTSNISMDVLEILDPEILQ